MNESGRFQNYICGKLLGDGCITKQEGRKPRFQFMHRTEDVGWAEYCYDHLKNFIPLSPPTYRKVIDSRIKKGYSESYIVQSRTDTVITDLYKQWYPSGKKVLPFDFIEQHLDERSLAWWYQDDGHLKIVNGIVNKVILSTDSFSFEENEWLIRLLFDKFNLRFVIDGQNRILLYDQFQIIYFLHLVSPCLHKSMNRKALPIQPIRPIAKRTTIYLPEKFKLVKPTSEINLKLDKLDTLFANSKKEVCIHTTFSTFNPLLSHKENANSYQIIIDEKHRQTLARIRQQTGLTISQLTNYCFSI
ncbi:endonuclease [Sporosarcina sp. E16_3]|uniref:endonuclease n=1 Tax=Sporosarcina sp. E16_3 TaxID=2789293 RepID=UPI001A92AAFB|nr:endonuclease [Sporosarcina sp. E16_3]MBO0601195.1 endonuclease [Sporosarcina sp. E16_3]